MDLRIGKFKTKEGVKLHYEQWTPEKPKGGIIVVHGVGEHCGRYRPFVDYFTKKGYKVCVYDQRGHGRSDGKRVYVRRFESFKKDLDAFSTFCQQGDSSNTGLAWFLVGHSMGGQIVLNYLAEFPGRFRAACATSPNLEIALTMPKWMEVLGKMVLYIWPTMKLKELTNPNWLTHDSKMVEEYLKDPLVYPYVTLGIGKEIVKNLERIFTLCNKIRTPLLMLHGSEDRYCRVNGTKRFFEELTLAQKQLKIYEGLYHELFNETNKEDIFHDVEHWFSRWVE